MKTKATIIAGICLFTVFLFFLLSLISRPQLSTLPFKNQPNMKTGKTLAVHKTLPQAGLTAVNMDTAPTQNDEASIEDRLVKELQKYYGKTISSKSTQILLLKVKDFVVNLFPKNGEAKFNEILHRAFPSLADEIILTLIKLEQYNHWLAENKKRLTDMNDLERNGSIWEKRQEMFGDEAKEIWSDEMYAYEDRKQNMKETMSLLDESYDTTIDEKLDVYMSTLNKTYADTPEAYALENKGLLAKVFMGIKSVQKDLKGMDPDSRQIEINNIRREMGFTQAQVEEHQKMDEYRNRRWENGLAYMDERDQLTAEYNGKELDEKLTALRKKYFKHEAKTIELEEKDNFFRFKRERIYGRN